MTKTIHFAFALFAIISSSYTIADTFAFDLSVSSIDDKLSFSVKSKDAEGYAKTFDFPEGGTAELCTFEEGAVPDKENPLFFYSLDADGKLTFYFTPKHKLTFNVTSPYPVSLRELADDPDTWPARKYYIDFTPQNVPQNYHYEFGVRPNGQLELYDIPTSKHLKIDAIWYTSHIDSNLFFKDGDRYLAGNFFNNAELMIRGNPNFVTSARLSNKGLIECEDDFMLKAHGIDNEKGQIKGFRKLKIETPGLNNKQGFIAGAAGTELSVGESYENAQGQIGYDKETKLTFEESFDRKIDNLGTLEGDEVYVIFKNKKLKVDKGYLKGSQKIEIITGESAELGLANKVPDNNSTKAEHLPDNLILNTKLCLIHAAAVGVGAQNMCATLAFIMLEDRLKTLSANLTAGRLEFREHAENNAENTESKLNTIQEKPTKTIEILHPIKARGGMGVYGAHSVLTVGDPTKESIELNTKNKQEGDNEKKHELKAKATLADFKVGSFDFANAQLFSEEASVYAPFGLKVGQHVFDRENIVVVSIFKTPQVSYTEHLGAYYKPKTLKIEGQEAKYANDKAIISLAGEEKQADYNGYVFSFPYLTSNKACLGATEKLFLKSRAQIDIDGNIDTNALTLDSPEDTVFNSGESVIKGSLHFKGKGGAVVKREMLEVAHNNPNKGYKDVFVASTPAALHVTGHTSSEHPITIHNYGSSFHTGTHDPHIYENPVDLEASRYQVIAPKSAFNWGGGQSLWIRWGFSSLNCDAASSVLHLGYTHPNRSYHGWGVAPPQNPFYPDGNFGNASRFLLNNYALLSTAKRVFGANDSSNSNMLILNPTRLSGSLTAPNIGLLIGDQNCVIGNAEQAFNMMKLPYTDFATGTIDTRRARYSLAEIKEFFSSKDKARNLFLWQDKLRFDQEDAHQFYADIQKHVVLLFPDQSTEIASDNSIFTYCPNILLNLVIGDCTDKLKRGMIELNQDLTLETLKIFHQNMTQHLRENGGRFTPANINKPVIFYKKLRGENNVLSLSPLLYYPQTIVDEANPKRGGCIIADNLLALTADVSAKRALAGTGLEDNPGAVALGHNSFDVVPSTKRGGLIIHDDIKVGNFLAAVNGPIHVFSNIRATNILLRSLLSDVIFEAQVKKIQDGNKEEETLFKKATAIAHEMLVVMAAGNIIFEATDTYSGLHTHFEALGSIYHLSVPEIAKACEKFLSKHTVRKVNQTTIHHKGGTHSSGQSYSEKAGQDIVMTKATINAQEGDIEAGRDVLLEEVHDINYIELDEEKEKKRSKKHTTGQTLQKTSKGSTLNIAQNTITAENEAKLVGTTLTGNTALKAKSAKVLDGTDTYESTLNVHSENKLVHKDRSASTTHNSPSISQIGGTVEIDADDAYVEDVDPSKVKGVNGTQIKHHKVEAYYHHHDKTKTILAPEARFVINAVACAAIASTGIGGGFAAKLGLAKGTAGYAAASAAFTSAASAVTSQAACNSFDEGMKGFRKTFRGKNLKRIGVDAIVAGATAGAVHDLNSYFKLDAKKLSFIQDLKKEFIHLNVATIIQTSLQGGKLAENYVNNAKQASVDLVARRAAGAIGDLYDKDKVDPFTHKIMHSVAGGLAAEFSGTDFTSGAVAAALAETVAEIYQNVKLEAHFDEALKLQEELGENFDRERRDQFESDFARECTLVGRFTALATALALDHDLKGADLAANNALDHNFAPHLIWGTYVIGSTVYAAYDAYYAYVEAGGGEAGAWAALESLGYDVTLLFAGGVAGKVAAKGAKPALEYLNKLAGESRILRHALGRAKEAVAKAADKASDVAAKAAGKVGDAVAGSAVGKAGKVIAQKAEQIVAKVGGSKVKSVDWKKAAQKAQDEADAGFAPGSVGAAKVWTKKGRIKAAQLPTEGKIRFVPDKHYKAGDKLPTGKNGGYLDQYKNEWKRGPSRTQGEAFEWDVILSESGKQQLGWASKNGKYINISLKGEITH